MFTLKVFTKESDKAGRTLRVFSVSSYRVEEEEYGIKSLYLPDGGKIAITNGEDGTSVTVYVENEDGKTIDRII